MIIYKKHISDFEKNILTKLTDFKIYQIWTNNLNVQGGVVYASGFSINMKNGSWINIFNEKCAINETFDVFKISVSLDENPINLKLNSEGHIIDPASSFSLISVDQVLKVYTTPQEEFWDNTSVSYDSSLILEFSNKKLIFTAEEGGLPQVSLKEMNLTD